MILCQVRLDIFDDCLCRVQVVPSFYGRSSARWKICQSIIINHTQSLIALDIKCLFFQEKNQPIGTFHSPLASCPSKPACSNTPFIFFDLRLRWGPWVVSLGGRIKGLAQECPGHTPKQHLTSKPTSPTTYAQRNVGTPCYTQDLIQLADLGFWSSCLIFSQKNNLCCCTQFWLVEACQKVFYTNWT